MVKIGDGDGKWIRSHGNVIASHKGTAAVSQEYGDEVTQPIDDCYARLTGSLEISDANGSRKPTYTKVLGWLKCAVPLALKKRNRAIRRICDH